MHGKIIDLPIKPAVSLVRKGNRTGKEASTISMKLSEQDAAHYDETCTAEIPISISG